MEKERPTLLKEDVLNEFKDLEGNPSQERIKAQIQRSQENLGIEPSFGSLPNEDLPGFPSLNGIKENLIDKTELLNRARRFNGLISNVDGLFEHMERLQKCTKCNGEFYDKMCSSCVEKSMKKKESRL